MLTAALKENLSFMVVEVARQLDDTLDFLQNGDAAAFQQINSRDDYIDNLKTVIENRCFTTLGEAKTISQRERDRIQATHTICVNLERIGDFCVSAADQLHYLNKHAILQHFDYQQIFDILAEHLQVVIPVLEKGDMGQALAICRAENQIDVIYKENFDKIMEELRRGKEIENLITVLFIFRYLERMGDSLLNIGEALLLSILGEKIKIEQFQALEETLSKSGLRTSLAEVEFSSILGSRSGCRISKVQGNGGLPFLAPQTQSSIFKEGNREKILTEKKNLERWNEIFPDLTPRLFSYQESEETASLLVEFLPGRTLEAIILKGDPDELHTVCMLLHATVLEIWTRTKKTTPIKANFIPQIMARMHSVLSVHPDFHRASQDIGSSEVMATDELLAKCRKIEEELAAPFSVFIHGDFNVNNIIYNAERERIQFIDLYRSREADYIQDVSVFIASNFRQPVFQEHLRERLNWFTKGMYQMAKNFAVEQGDETFELRMALALARSFYTSTRFELNNDFANEMFLRSHFLLEKVLAHQDKPWQTFSLPSGIMYY
ncbi:PhoU domain-containing protein [Thiovibrio frasassiensis]|uniref:Phosphotransferase n=1 Tax=Thiovibrio frasassiensis TaxID=2984131 RepID=A0A9X4MH04_9BACT|nr:PhoU domain-containing protein [Thiovibrio frasassiensis]MDG4476186.1 phosphotransferase [Thiovibrio frasassiensis]